jgi:hypothetical protein
MLTNTAHYQNVLAKLLVEEVERLKEVLASGYNSETFDISTYRHYVGKIEGLRLALEYIGEAEAIMLGKDRG